MHEQFSQLKALLDSERKARVEQAHLLLFPSDVEKARAEAENELKEVRSAFEGTVWTRVGLEEEVKKMEKETYFLKKMLDELSASTNNSVGIEEKIESLESQVEEREFLTRVLKRLQDQTRVMRNTLDLHIQGKNANYADLESKRNELRRKLRARGDVERVIMELEDEVESLKAQIKQEEKAREQQEWLVDIEINDLSKRQAHSPLPLNAPLSLGLEIAAREKTRKMIDQAAAHRKKIVQELEALKARAVASPGGMRDGKEGARNEFRKSFHPAAFHRTQSGPNIDEKKDDEAQPSSSLSAGSFSPVRESSSLFVSGEMVFKGGSSGSTPGSAKVTGRRESLTGSISPSLSLSEPRESDSELGDLPFTRNLQDLRNKVDEVWEVMSEEGDRSRSLERELKEMQKAVDEEREERRRLVQAMAEERERREELERKLTRVLELHQQGASPAQE
ncbi:uncharacterized protein ACA1_157260 [Acanthamoeba castellanii str. Neff]|uniref:Uncharacterized protein n=1 Tax=Acanthamoeba castellanii (strain ATCC 30010 / Neff) TaxID=1257118 RepID=L8H919_ACACF|nr:uncharacterized protein ACA1_157260 [Acanthamoeba castellanii str. Neff]ELR22004.1 hypothetical protein ACA1_157260 [Acanthamoeba castellanii str. Neff]